MLYSPIGPENLLDKDISEKFWHLRGQVKFWTDTMFIDCLCTFFIVAYFITVSRCFKHLMAMFESKELQMNALMAWASIFFFLFSLLALSKHLFLCTWDIRFQTWTSSLMELLTMSPRALAVTNSDAEGLRSYTALMYTLLMALACTVFIHFIPYAVMICVLQEGYRSV